MRLTVLGLTHLSDARTTGTARPNCPPFGTHIHLAIGRCFLASAAGRVKRATPERRSEPASSRLKCAGPASLDPTELGARRRAAASRSVRGRNGLVPPCDAPPLALAMPLKKTGPTKGSSMTPERRAELARWRDFMLWTHHRSESAKARLSPEPGGFDDALVAASGVIPPTDDEAAGCDINGEPLDPEHPWWGNKGMSAIEKRARERGLWLPSEPNPYTAPRPSDD